MDSLIFPILFFGLACYFIGFFFSKEIFSNASSFFVKVIKFNQIELWRKWNDRILIIAYTSVTISSLALYLFFKEKLKEEGFLISDLIQSEIFFATLFTLIYSTLLRDKANDYRNRPVIGLKFEDSEPQYFHRTLMTIQTQLLVQQQGYTNIVPLVESVSAYYVRFKIVNEGRTTLNNTEVLIEKVEAKGKTKILRPFMPLNLHWAFAEDKERRKIKIPPKAFRIIDFMELTNSQQTRAYAAKLTPGAIDYDRYNALVTGFRICSIPPNTLSDIFEKGSYIFTIGIYADNAEPTYKKISVDFDGGWNNEQKVMRSNHLKVRLLGS
jgi:hypothetical protein